MINARAKLAIQTHAIECYPNEACGVVLASGDYVPLENVAPDPTTSFALPGQAYAAVLPDVVAIVHSHPDGPDCPSAADMRSQIDTQKPWIIVSCNADGALEPFAFGDGVAVPRLVGRGFRHGVTDCYALIRDWYKLKRSIDLPEFPRDWEWWTEGGDLYRDGFAEAGFYRIDEQDVQAGDVFLAAIRSDVPNHGGVYLGNGEALHHLTGRLAVDSTRISRREPVGRWSGFLSHWLRHSSCSV